MGQLVTLHFRRKWSFHEDVGGNVVRDIPDQWIGGLEREPAAMAIAEGVASPTSPLDAEMETMVGVYKALLALMAEGLSFEEAVAQLDAASAETDDDESDEDLPAAEPAAAKPAAKPKKKKATAG